MAMAIGHPLNFQKTQSRDVYEASKKVGKIQQFMVEHQEKIGSNPDDLGKIDETLNHLSDLVREIAVKKGD